MGLSAQEKILWRMRDALFAPPATRHPVEGPVVLAGLFRAASGVGEAARALAATLEERGIPFLRVDLSGVFGQEDLPADEPLQTMPPDRTGTLIVHVNAPETDRALLALRLFRPRAWRVIGYWVWETSRAPDAWKAKARRLSELWTPSRHSADAIQAATGRRPLLAPHRIAPPAQIIARRSDFGLPDDAVVFLTMADGRSSFHRKNPAGAVAAFKAGVGQNPAARMIVKIRNADESARQALRAAANGDPRIMFLEENLSADARWSLIACCDVFVSLHRAEGFGLPIGEAMALGKAVIATGWSGNMEFMPEGAACVAPYRLAPVMDPTGVYKAASLGEWAEPDVSAAASFIERLAADRDERVRLGLRARQAAAPFRSPPIPL
jgi:glycosyltransferase involved in cell wall biosynthesis